MSKKRAQRKAERLRREWTPVTGEDGDVLFERDAEDFQRIAEREVEAEDQLIWAYYRASDWTQREVVEHVVDEPDERPTQSQISRIVNQQATQIFKSSIHELPYEGQWLEDEISTEDIDEGFLEYARDALARFIVVYDTGFELFSPERPALSLGDIPDWAAERVDVDPMTVKVEKYWDRDITEEKLSPAVKRQVHQPAQGDD
jgi:hypothetical protein